LSLLPSPISLQPSAPSPWDLVAPPLCDESAAETFVAKPPTDVAADPADDVDADAVGAEGPAGTEAAAAASSTIRCGYIYIKGKYYEKTFIKWITK